MIAESGSTMEYGSIERQFHVQASPEVVFEVVSSPAHLQEWWADQAELEPVPGAVGELVWGDELNPRAHVASITVVDVVPPQRFSFRWMYPEDEAAAADNSLLVTFELAASEAGTEVRMTETGFREKGWEVAVLEEQYREHSAGWDLYLGRLAKYAGQLVST